ncbi:putative integral membrane proteinc [Roseibacterium elongatum DSM 19469]|uniref:Putative integral membrane proteinc n=1 Tax=Roseicyclus elongatus DSM 19469 TaxID=1294273 RepID=W8S7Y2_9RHOB|nr:putative integral membrane proteinc [Roseibacterium elongatum DSM 19469]
MSRRGSEGAAVETEIEVAYWADIVRASMQQGVLATYGQLLRTAWAYIGSGALFRLMRLRKGPVIAALYPVVLLLAELVIAAVIGVVAGLGLYQVLVWSATGLGLFGTGGGVTLAFALIAATGGGAMVWLVLRWCQRRDALFEWYLMHDYAFSARLGGAFPQEQEARMAEVADRIAEALKRDLDEVLIVGHSSGAYLAVSILADLIRDGRVPNEGPCLSFLTLGHVVPMVAFLPRADRLRADLAYLSTRPELSWVDVSAPGDGCCFALCDPVAVSGVAPVGKRWPLILSAAYTQTLKPETWAALRWRLFELHFQYLNAFDNLSGAVGEYDYFRVTAGPLTLWQRFGRRAPSASRIERAVNRHTGQKERPKA